MSPSVSAFVYASFSQRVNQCFYLHITNSVAKSPGFFFWWFAGRLSISASAITSPNFSPSVLTYAYARVSSSVLSSATASTSPCASRSVSPLASARVAASVSPRVKVIASAYLSASVGQVSRRLPYLLCQPNCKEVSLPLFRKVSCLFFLVECQQFSRLVSPSLHRPVYS